MLRDEHSDGGRRLAPARNVLGEPLEICSFKPMRGFYRDGCCNTGQEDVDSHTICAVMTAQFLAFPNHAVTTFPLLCQNLASPACNRATVGVYALRVGRRHWKLTVHRGSCCAPRIKVY
jgi:hypothetical protein